MLGTTSYLESFADITDHQDLLIQVAPNYGIVALNPLAERVFGALAHELQGKDIFTLCGERGWALPFFAEGKEPQVFQADVDTTIHWRTFSLPDTNNRLQGFMIIGHVPRMAAPSNEDGLSPENIIAHIPSFVYWKDNALCYRGCNENFAQWVGLKSPADIIGKKDKALFEQSEVLQHFKKDKRVLAGVPLIDEEVDFSSLVGHPHTIRVSKVPLRDKNNTIIGLLSIHTDITLIKQREALLVLAKESAEAANKAKTEFIADISHDLRTSLNVIRGMSKLLLERQHVDEQRPLINGVLDAAHNLTQQIDEILDYSKIESGKISLRKISFDLQKTLEEVIDAHSFEAYSKGVNLLHDYSSMLPTQVVGDPVATKRIFANLVSNALKFTQQGHLLLRVSCSKNQNDSAWFEFTVEDTGIGIAKEKLSTIFNRFERVDDTQESLFQGTGLGLSIVAWLVKRLGGGVDVTSEVGKGTTFKVSLPFDCCVNNNLEGDVSDNQRISFPILLIDDYMPRAKVTADLLGVDGVTIVDSANAISRFLRGVQQGHPYKVVLLNEDITECPLALLLKAMNHQPEFSRATIALLVCESYRLDQATQSLVKPYVHIVKPIKPSKIGEQVAELISVEKSLELTLDTPLQPINYNGIGKLLLVEDEPLSQKYCQLLLQGRGYELDIAGNAKIALDFAAKQRYESILMDVGLPDASGVDVARAIRASDNPNRDVPIIALTAHIDESKQQACLDAGMTAFLNKPVSPDKLCELLKRVVV